MKRSTARLIFVFFVICLFIVPAALANHEWEITGVTCDPENNRIRISGISGLESTSDTEVYVNGVYIGTYDGPGFQDGPETFTVTHPLIVAGAHIYVANAFNTNWGGPTDASTTCRAGGGSVTWFEPGDDRINRQAYAPIAVYCAETQLEILAIDANGAGTPALVVDYGSLPETPAADAGNTVIGSAGNLTLYRLTSGEYLARVGPDAEGKFYRLVWDGCPQTYIQASIEQNGVVTPAETYSW